MAKTKVKVAPSKKAAPVKKESPKSPSVSSGINTTKIQELTCKKHQRIFLLIDAGCAKEEIMQLAGANAGEISNVRKLYADKPEKATEAKALIA